MTDIQEEQWPTQLHVSVDANKTVVIFPRRKVWKWIPVAALILIVSMIVGSFLIYLGILSGVRVGIRLSVIVACGYLAFVFNTIKAVLPSHAEVEMTEEELISREIRWPDKGKRAVTWRMKWSEVEKVQVESAASRRLSKTLLAPTTMGEAYLRITKKDDLEYLATGYPKVWLLKLADELVKRAGTKTAPQFEDLSDLPEHMRDVESLPTNSRIRRNEIGDSVIYSVPATGFWSRTVTFASAMIVLSGSLLFMMWVWKRDQLGQWDMPGLACIVIAICIFLSVTMMFLMNRFLRRFIIVVTSSTVTIARRGLFGKRERHLSIKNIVAARCDFLSDFQRLREDGSQEMATILETRARSRLVAAIGAEPEMRWLAMELRRMMEIATKSD